MPVGIDFLSNPPTHSKIAQWVVFGISLLIDVISIVILLVLLEGYWIGAVIGGAAVIAHALLTITLLKELRYGYFLMIGYLIYEVLMLFYSAGSAIYGITQLDYVAVSTSIIVLLFRLIVLHFFKALYHYVRVRAPDFVQTTEPCEDC